MNFREWLRIDGEDTAVAQLDALLIVIAFGVFGLLVHKPLETAFQSVLRIRNTPAANRH